MPVDKDKARAREEARKRMKAPVAKPHPKKGYTMQADDAVPHAAGRSKRRKKLASTGEQGAHPRRPKRKKLEL